MLDWRNLNLAILAAAVQRRWLLCTILGCCAAGCGALSALVCIPPTYIATANVLLWTDVSNVFEANSDTPPNHFSASSDTQTRIARLPRVLRAALQDPHVKDLSELRRLTATRLAERVDATIVRGTNIMAITVSHESPRAAQYLANAMATSYMREAEKLKNESIDRRLQALQAIGKKYDDRLQNAYEHLGELVRDLGTGDPTTLALREEIELERKKDHSARLHHIQCELRNLKERRHVDAVHSDALDALIESRQLEETFLKDIVATSDRRLEALGSDKYAKLLRLHRELLTASYQADALQKALARWEVARDEEHYVLVQDSLERPTSLNVRDRNAAAILAATASAALTLLAVALWELRPGA